MSPASELFERLHGLNVRVHSADYWLQSAIDAEEIAKACGPHDPAFRIYIRNRDLYFKAAEIRENLNV